MRNLILFVALAVFAGSGPAEARTSIERDLEGRSICWKGHGRADFRRDHTYAYAPPDGRPEQAGRWGIVQHSILFVGLKNGENQYVTLDMKGSRIAMIDGDKWTGRLCP